MEIIHFTTRSHCAVYKTGYIVFAAVFTSSILLLYSYLLKGLIPSSNLFREYCICFGQLLFQGTLLLLFSKKEMILNYLFEMMKVSLIGAFLLSPVLVSAILFFPFSPGLYYYLGYFFVIVLYMFFNHKKRVKELQAAWWLTYTWVLYRFIVLLIIL
ncbi:MAG: hypothetical protein H0W61_14835 [Bacteroidetes bacterium]|nr:hypothetical protein [Bacteroidota bacterium]